MAIDYLHWQSSLTLEQVFKSNDESVSYPQQFGDGFIYLTSLKEEKSRTVLKFQAGRKAKVITPELFCLRTKINEYGGKPFWIDGNQIVFVNQVDQCLYSQHFENGKFSDPKRVSICPDGETLYMYSDLQRIDDSKTLAVIEAKDLANKDSENRCFIGLLDFSLPNAVAKEIVAGADFYSNLVYDQESRNLAWVQWQHPNMPWDSNQAMIATLGANQSLSEPTALSLSSGSAEASHCQLAFAANGKLFLSADFQSGDTESDENADNFWNVYAWDPVSKQSHRVTTSSELEFGYPHWQYGDARIIACSEASMIAVGSAPMGDMLFLIDADDYSTRVIYDNQSTIQSLSCNSDNIITGVESSKSDKPRMLALDYSKPKLEPCYPIKHQAYPYPVSCAQEVSFPTRDDDISHGFYYPPVNHTDVDASTIGAPPLIVMVHGGPTARAYSHFDLQKQFWASNGFAVFDVNHRGSSGYGRAYRDQLYGQWGEMDASDIADGVKWLVEQSMADVDRVCIRGKSAGGYAVLRALTEYPDIFKAGACYYGIGNLTTLAQTTHKFEKHYTDRLVDESFEPEFASTKQSKFHQRSPIHKIDRIKSAMIIFQGAEDNVVPPIVAHEMVDSLKAKGVPYQYFEYPDEGHGFRQVDNNIDALTKEIKFYRSTLLNGNES